MKWTIEAEAELLRAPFFVRRRVKKRVEKEASEGGAKEVTLSHMRSCQQKFLNRMEDEVKGFQVEACFGQTGCKNRAVEANSLVRELEELLSARDLKIFLKTRVDGPLKIHHEFRISVSDCPNSCSRPQIADIGLIGASRPVVTETECRLCGSCEESCQEGAISLKDNGPVIEEAKCLFCKRCIQICPALKIKEAESGFRVLMGGKLGRHPRLGAELHRLYNSEEVKVLVEKSLDHYMRHCKAGERFGVILDRTGLNWLCEE
jgi:dissimilatory sulfite reductase (desulfoviridin) alpha/beta subunit